MKKLIVLFLINVFVVGGLYSIVFANEKVHSIDIQEKKCIEQNYSDANMNSCVMIATKAWENEIENLSKSIEKELSETQILAFRASQQAWKDYYAKEKHFVEETIYTKQGTINVSVGLSQIQSIVKERALYLDGYLYDLTEI